MNFSWPETFARLNAADQKAPLGADDLERLAEAATLSGEEAGVAALPQRAHNAFLAAGVERVPRVAGVRDGLPLLADDRVLDVANLIWCTGFKTDFDWVRLPVFGDDGRPAQYRGVVPSQPGLYFVGLEFQYAATSGVLPGIVRDARYLAEHVMSRQPLRAGTQTAVGEYAAVSMPK